MSNKDVLATVCVCLQASLHLLFELDAIFMPPFEEKGVYSFRTVRQAVRLSICHTFCVRSLIQIVFIRSLPNLVRSCIQTISRSSSNMGHAGSKTRSWGHLVHFKDLAWCVRHTLRVRSLIHIVFIRSSTNLLRSCI